MENTVKERLKLYLRINRITQEKFCNSVGVAPTYVSNIRKGIQPDKLTRIQQAYPDLNIEWLVTGRGEMLNSTPTTTEDTTDTQENIVRVIPIAAHGGMLTNFDIDSIEGVKCESDHVFSVQYHPESAPGPQDSVYLFDRFVKMMEEYQNA